MTNFRIINENAADTATLSATAAASVSTGVANLLTDTKGEVYRSASASCTITATWATAQLIGGVALAFGTASASTTIRVKCYTNAGDASPVLDSGVILACPATPLGIAGWGSQPLGVNAYSYGGSTDLRCWLSTIVSCKKVEVIVSDPASVTGYVEFARLVLGSYWEGQKNIDYGAAITPADLGKNVRNDATDLVSEPGGRIKKLTFSLSKMGQTDRARLWAVLWRNGITTSMWVSLYPNDADTSIEQASQGLFKLVTLPAMTAPSFLTYASSLEMESV